VSILEAFDLITSISGKKMNHEYLDQHRVGDHICYVSNLEKLKADYPGWAITKDLKTTVMEIHDTRVCRQTAN
jgi:CDP-paratose 2-epimerase